jgi:TonB-linked outer membrane protein, SusC/RagA family
MKQKREKMKSRLFLLWAFLLIGAFEIHAQNITVRGNVKDEIGDPVIGASVKVEGNTTTGTVTDMDGNFSLSVPPSAKRLEISFIGMQKQQVNIVAGQPVNVILKEDAELLDEVVVIGYQTVKRRDLTGSVASVSGKAIAATPVTNVAQALQGKLPGVNVTSQDGRPDATVSIRIRGGGSISQSNEPLILVDGVTVSSLSDIPGDQVESIDVLKDASSTAIYGARGANGVILVTTKGAKEGKVSVSYNGYVKFNTPTKYLDALNPYDYLKYVWANTAAHGDAYRIPFEKLYGIGDYTGENTGGIESYRNMSSDDIQRDVYNSSVSHNHDLSVTGGTDKTKVLFSVNYTDDKGMKINSYSKRANVSLKVNQKLFDNVDLNIDTRYTDIKNLGDEGTTSGSGSLLSSSYRFRPIATHKILGDLDALREGNMEQYGKFSSWDTYSPKNRISDYDPLKIKQHLRGTASLNWVLIKGLTYHTDFTLNRSWNQNKTWGGAIYNNYIDDATGEKLYAGSVDYEKSDSWGLRWTNTLSYDVSFANIHKLNVLAGHEITNSGGSKMRIQANHFPSNFSKENAFAMINQYDQEKGTSAFSSETSTPGRIVSFFGRANYTLQDRYLLTLTFRGDGSSKFAPDNRWGYFPAAAVAWRVSEESFMQNIDWLDNLKLRLSYGEVGNDGISSNLWSQLWTSETDRRWQHVADNKYLSAYDLASTQMANKDLKWETTVTRGAGLDFSLFNSRVWGSVDLYRNTTKDLLMLTSIPGITGFTSTYANIGKTSNKGVEFSLSGLIFKNKDWNITAGANINFNKGNVDELAENVTGLYGTRWASSSSYPADDYILKEGSPVGIVRGLIYDGFYTTDDFNYVNGQYILKEGVSDLGNFVGPVNGIGSNERPSGQIAYPGLIKYRDLDNSGTIGEEDITTIGDMNPVHTGGFNISATYKNFDFGAYFNWSYGNDVYNVNKLGSLYGYKESGVYENKFDMLNNAYKIYNIVNGKLERLSTPEQLNAANANASLPLALNENGVTSSLGIEDGSFLRLNTLVLGYTLPNQLTRKAGINNLRVYGSIYNLFTITGYSGLDPEVNANTSANHAVYPTTGLDWGTYPRARSFVVGVNLNF